MSEAPPPVPPSCQDRANMSTASQRPRQKQATPLQIFCGAVFGMPGTPTEMPGMRAPAIRTHCSWSNSSSVSPGLTMATSLILRFEGPRHELIEDLELDLLTIVKIELCLFGCASVVLVVLLLVVLGRTRLLHHHSSYSCSVFVTCIRSSLALRKSRVMSGVASASTGAFRLREKTRNSPMA